MTLFSRDLSTNLTIYFKLDDVYQVRVGHIILTH